MDMRLCDVCGVQFDFDETGLEGPNEVIVCSNGCAKKSAGSRGKKYVIHDKSDAIVETDLKPGKSQ